MPKVGKGDKDTPETLRPFIFHGVDLSWGAKDREAIADCPFCGREGKFTVNIERGVYRCFVCSEGTEKGGGNAITFIRNLYDRSFEATTTKEYRELCKDRKLLYEDTLVLWGLAKSITTQDWIIPGYGPGGDINQVYRYIYTNEKRRFLLTPTLGHQLFGVNTYNKDTEIVYLCEGPWDAISLWEVLKETERKALGHYSHTADLDSSMLANAAVLAVPGCETFFDKWVTLFSGKIVYLCYDNDHPRRHPKTDAIIEPGALKGMRKAVGVISGAKEPPVAISFLDWGKETGESYNSALPSGYDLRDGLNSIKTDLFKDSE